MPPHEKLVRDGVPAHLARTGVAAVVRRLDPADFPAALRAKLDEEIAELDAATGSGRIEELADILEVVLAIAASEGTGAAELEAVRRRKADARGGFHEGAWLVSTQD